MMAAITWDLDPVFFNIGNFELRYYSLCWILAFVAAYFVMKYIFKKEDIKEERLVSLTVYVILGTFIGARLGHCLFYEPQYYLAHPWEIILPISQNAVGKWVFTGYQGLASHGGAVGIIVAILLFSRKFKMKFLDVADKLGVVAPLAGAFIRLGNLFNSEIIGKATSLPWGFVFTRVDDVPRHPAQLYEALAYIAIFVLAFYLYRKMRSNYKPGFIFGMSIAGIFLARFFIEYTKEVQEAFEITMLQTIGMDMGQLLSLPFVIIGVWLMIVKYGKPQQPVKPVAAAPKVSPKKKK